MPGTSKVLWLPEMLMQMMEIVLMQKGSPRIKTKAKAKMNFSREL